MMLQIDLAIEMLPMHVHQWLCIDDTVRQGFISGGSLRGDFCACTTRILSVSMRTTRFFLHLVNVVDENWGVCCAGQGLTAAKGFCGRCCTEMDGGAFSQCSQPHNPQLTSTNL
jgi:hypothetical protein